MARDLFYKELMEADNDTARERTPCRTPRTGAFSPQIAGAAGALDERRKS